MNVKLTVNWQKVEIIVDGSATNFTSFLSKMAYNNPYFSSRYMDYHVSKDENIYELKIWLKESKKEFNIPFELTDNLHGIKCQLEKIKILISEWIIKNQKEESLEFKI